MTVTPAGGASVSNRSETVPPSQPDKVFEPRENVTLASTASTATSERRHPPAGWYATSLVSLLK